MLIVAASVFAGCGESPSAKFVLSERTTKLDRAARNAVEKELQRSFGDANHLVAWRKLPVDFGEFEGVVEKAGEPLVVQLSRKAPAVVSLKLDDLKGAGLVWTSGANADLVSKDAKGKETPVDFLVERFDPATSQLQTRVAGDAAVAAKAPQQGDKFVVVGPALQHGRKLYMTHCVHCHGVSGDGNGPTAKYLHPTPRDYRQGLFKFTSTRNPDKVRRDDLKRIIRQGIPGTYMPSFLLLKDDELSPIVEYVRWLAQRGEFEQKSVVEFEVDFSAAAVADALKAGQSRDAVDAALGKFIDGEYPAKVREIADDMAGVWTACEEAESVVSPKKSRTPDSPESRARGRTLYLSDVAKCATCHGPIGRGDGPQTEDYQNIPGTTKKFSEPGLFDAWNNAIKPRDLTTGIYRGGRRPVDIYRRIHSGIKGTPMPPFGSALTDDQIWDLVNYVMNLPFDKGGSHAEQQPKVASAGSDSRSGGGN